MMRLALLLCALATAAAVDVIDVPRVPLGALINAPALFRIEFFGIKPVIITGVFPDGEDTTAFDTAMVSEHEPGVAGDSVAFWGLTALMQNFELTQTDVLLHAWESDYNATRGHATRKPLAARMTFREWITGYIRPRLAAAAAGGCSR